MKVKQLTVTDVISNIIETLAMMTVDNTEQLEDFCPDFQAYIDFEGSVSGRLTLECTKQFANALAENLLGLESDKLEEAHRWDAIGELLNVVCGNLVTEIFDSQKPFTLSVPQVSFADIDFKADNEQDDENQQIVQFIIDNYPVRFALKFM